MERRSKSPNALKHGAYCESVLLPGESAANFEELRRDLIDELKPDGPLEQDIVQTIARLIWRKQNMLTYRRAQMAHKQISAIYSKYFSLPFPTLGERKEISADERAAYEQEVKMVRKELGEASELIDAGEIATTKYLLDQLAIEDRLDAVIDRCLKRLLMARGIKSMTPQLS